MKNLNYLALPLLLLVFASCKKDNIQPVISLIGDYEVVLPLNQAYVEAGATAKDNKDGDISGDIVISGSINVNEAGEYRLFYDVEDSKGNKAATATRYINVVNNADYMVGTYLATPNCSGTGTTYNTTVTTSSTDNNQIFIKRVIDYVEDEPVVGNVSGNTIDIPSQAIGGNTISGTGTITGNSFLLDVTINGWITYNCTIDHIKL